MIEREYRIVRAAPKVYQVRIVYGLMDVEWLNRCQWFASSKAARDAAKAHAELAGVKPLIITE